MTLEAGKLDSDQLEAVEAILCQESGCIAPEDVDPLMGVIRRELGNHQEGEYWRGYRKGIRDGEEQARLEAPSKTDSLIEGLREAYEIAFSGYHQADAKSLAAKIEKLESERDTQ